MSAEGGDVQEPAANKGRFAKGKSGNPRGRPRAPRSCLSLALAKAQGAKVVVQEGGKSRRMTKAELGATQLANKGAGGDLSALRLIGRIEAAGDGGGEAPPSAEERLRESDRMIVARLIERIRGGGGESQEDMR